MDNANILMAGNILNLFATYGFRKASMGDIARAADLSRQSIYNQFGSKEVVLEWAVTTFLDAVTDEALACFEISSGNPADVIATAYQTWIGEHVPLLRGTPHGEEILEKAISSASKAPRNYEKEFAETVEAFLLEQGLVSTRAEAQETAFVLHIASKGLLLKSDTREAFGAGMQRVIAVLFK